MLLAGDIGGTKTILALFAPAAGPRQPIMEATMVSADYASLGDMVRAFLRNVPVPPRHAAFGVAGPIAKGRATLTNLPWHLDEQTLATELEIESVALLNDLQAVAQAVPWLTAADLHPLQAGQPDPTGTIAVIAPGTGLGEAFLTWDGTQHRAFAAEGGHSDFAPTDALEIELLRFLMPRFGHVSYERVCSGRGIPNLYTFLREQGTVAAHPGIAAQIATAADPTPIIMRAALERTCNVCIATLDLFVSILGARAGNLALTTLATGGVYLGGGIPPRIVPQLSHPRFGQAFRSKGRFEALLSQIPIYMILNPKAALIGAACYGLTFQPMARTAAQGEQPV